MAQYDPTKPSHPSDPRQRISTHYYQQHYPQPVVYGPAPSGQRSSQGGQRPLRGHGGKGHGEKDDGRSARQKRALVAGGSMLALATLVVTPSINRADNALKTGTADVCIKQIDKQSLMSRDELKAILDLENNSPKANLQEIVAQPHCVLEARAGTDGVPVEREAYPLEFDPQTWFVLQYKGEEFVGFDFSFR
jgi:hypothetical protein